MQGRIRNMISVLTGAVLAAVSVCMAFSSCERIYDDLEPCPHGVSLRFVYDYNMEYANSFPRKVDCLTLYIYDDKGNWAGTRTVTGACLQDESYRMKLDLAEGTWHFVAYRGLACDDKSFSLADEPSQGSTYTDLCAVMDRGQVESSVAEQRRLHDMFWGELTLASADLYSEGTVRMMKNTNNIRIVLQQENGGQLSPEDFIFEITDNNSVFSYDNSLVTEGVAPVTYSPWAVGQEQTGVSIVGGNVVPEAVVVAYAEMSTSRLVTGNAPKLVIRRSGDGSRIVDFPLVEYLLLLRSERYRKMGEQEYLDRESDYVLFFFLRPDHSWINTHIVVDKWVVRLNNAEF